MHLTVISPFSVQEKDHEGKPVGAPLQFDKGAKIYDTDEIMEVLSGENSRHVVRTADLGDPVNGAKAI